VFFRGEMNRIALMAKGRRTAAVQTGRIGAAAEQEEVMNRIVSKAAGRRTAAMRWNSA
jgi:hypothetical protein